jgi:hypothetical protein
MLSPKPSFHGRARHHFLRDHVEKGDIEMKYIDIERQLADIFTKPLDATHFASLWGGRTWCLPSLWHGLRGQLVFYLVYTLSYLYRIAFHSYLPNVPIDLLIMLACIW